MSSIVITAQAEVLGISTWEKKKKKKPLGVCTSKTTFLLIKVLTEDMNKAIHDQILQM